MKRRFYSSKIACSYRVECGNIHLRPTAKRKKKNVAMMCDKNKIIVSTNYLGTPAVFDDPVVFLGLRIRAVTDQQNGMISQLQIN